MERMGRSQEDCTVVKRRCHLCTRPNAKWCDLYGPVELWFCNEQHYRSYWALRRSSKELYTWLRTAPSLRNTDLPTEIANAQADSQESTAVAESNSGIPIALRSCNQLCWRYVASKRSSKIQCTPSLASQIHSSEFDKRQAKSTLSRENFKIVSGSSKKRKRQT